MQRGGREPPVLCRQSPDRKAREGKPASWQEEMKMRIVFVLEVDERAVEGCDDVCPPLHPGARSGIGALPSAPFPHSPLGLPSCSHAGVPLASSLLPPRHPCTLLSAWTFLLPSLCLINFYSSSGTEQMVKPQIPNVWHARPCPKHCVGSNPCSNCIGVIISPTAPRRKSGTERLCNWP